MDTARVHAELAYALFRLARYDEALASLDRSIEHAADDSHVHLVRGECLMHLKRYADALAAFDAALALDPENSRAHRGRGLVARETGAL